MKFGERLRAIREDNSLKQSDLALKLDISRTSVSNYEKGSRIPDIDTAIKMADFFNVSMDYLVGRVDENTFEFIKVSDTSAVTKKIVYMIDMLPKRDQQLAFELIKRMVLTWDSDFTKLTPVEYDRLLEADREIRAGKVIDHAKIDWDK